MKPIFTIHAGEYLVGEALEARYKDAEIWLPAKDTGTDLLITSKNRLLNASIQVKFSKDFLPSMPKEFHDEMIACGFWSLNIDKMKSSNAEFWVLAPYSSFDKGISFVIIKPKELAERLISIHDLKNNSNKKDGVCKTYLWVTKNGRCFETRSISRKTKQELLGGNFSNIDSNRDFTNYLNNWKEIDERLSEHQSQSQSQSQT